MFDFPIVFCCFDVRLRENRRKPFKLNGGKIDMNHLDCMKSRLNVDTMMVLQTLALLSWLGVTVFAKGCHISTPNCCTEGEHAEVAMNLNCGVGFCGSILKDTVLSTFEVKYYCPDTDGIYGDASEVAGYPQKTQNLALFSKVAGCIVQFRKGKIIAMKEHTTGTFTAYIHKGTLSIVHNSSGCGSQFQQHPYVKDALCNELVAGAFCWQGNLSPNQFPGSSLLHKLSTSYERAHISHFQMVWCKLLLQAPCMKATPDTHYPGQPCVVTGLPIHVDDENDFGEGIYLLIWVAMLTTSFTLLSMRKCDTKNKKP